MSIWARLLVASCLAAGMAAVTVSASSFALTQPPDQDGKGAKDKDKDKDGPKGKKGGPKDKDFGPKGKEFGPKGKDSGPKGEDGPKHVADLRKAYGLLSESAALTRPAGKKKDGPRPDADGRRYFDAAARLYRDAVKAAGGDTPGMPELAAAAHDAARGLRGWLAATTPADPGLPPPPAAGAADPWEQAQAALRRAKDRLEDVGTAGSAGGKEFLAAARKAYADGRTAYEAASYEKAAAFARAAEAWSLVGEHLDRARGEDPKGDRPPPSPESEGIRPPPARPGRDVPPPPPPLGERDRVPPPNPGE